MPQLSFDRRQLDEFVDRNQGKDVQVLDMERVVKAAKIILQEEEVAAVVGSIKNRQANGSINEGPDVKNPHSGAEVAPIEEADSMLSTTVRTPDTKVAVVA